MEGHKGLKLTEYFAVAFAVISVISCINCKQFETAFLGTGGWGIGGGLICISVIFYLILSRSFVLHQTLWLPVIFTNIIIFGITVIQSMNVDVLGMHCGIYQPQYYNYVSTIGNVNWLSGYLCLLMPMLMLMYFRCSERASAVIYIVVVALGLFNVVLCSSDSVFLGIGLCLPFAIPYILSDEKYIARFGYCIAIAGIELLCMASLPVFEPKRETLNGIFAVITRWWIALVIVLAGVLMAFVAKRYYSSIRNEQRRKIVICAEILLLLCILGVLIITVVTFDDNWGTRRGYIWRLTWEKFWAGSMPRYLVGIGPDMTRAFYVDVSQLYGRTLVACHSEALQYLVTMGILGFSFWMAIWAGVIRSYFKGKVWKQDAAIVFFPSLIAYLGQSLVNSPMATNVAVLTVMTACYSLSYKEQIKGEEDISEDGF